MKAMLVEVSLLTRVVVEDNASESEIIKAAHANFQHCLYEEGTAYISDNLVSIEDDLEVPYEEEPWFENSYRCTNCGHEWVDEWSAQCDDPCPECGTVMTPYHSIEVEL